MIYVMTERETKDLRLQATSVAIPKSNQKKRMQWLTESEFSKAFESKALEKLERTPIEASFLFSD